MINQYIEAAIAELQEFIDNRPDAREVRKALAVKLVYQGYKYEEIQTILDVSVGSITGASQFGKNKRTQIIRDEHSRIIW
ncbi:transposase [Nostoc sphaeroides CCNUC1]|uniref:Transposase n=1 Tax=Nostoc sphaeroides CCNUC1 TaxID=2653204 RepID=A0A5P8WD56_9NOSO|nr:transposase [Nostoc sphaeroides CCNUC1]